jgi:hypothetical protein
VGVADEIDTGLAGAVDVVERSPDDDLSLVEAACRNPDEFAHL